MDCLCYCQWWLLVRRTYQRRYKGLGFVRRGRSPCTAPLQRAFLSLYYEPNHSFFWAVVDVPEDIRLAAATDVYSASAGGIAVCVLYKILFSWTRRRGNYHVKPIRSVFVQIYDDDARNSRDGSRRMRSIFLTENAKIKCAFYTHIDFH